MNNVNIYDEKQYKMTCTEMLEILKYIPEVDFDKIPLDIIEALKYNSDHTYNFKLDLDKSFEEQKISELTKAMIENFYRDYWVTGPERKKILQEENIVRSKSKEEKRQKYNTNNIFKSNHKMDGEENKQIKKENQSLELIEIKEHHFLKKVLEKIKSFLKKHNNL